jgi:YidC/Oxa1 family membrane protein insertase
MDKRTLLAFVLSFIVLVGWSLLFGPERQPPPATQQPASSGPSSQKAPEKKSEITEAEKAALKQVMDKKADERLIEVDTPLYRAVLTSVGPGIKSFKLKNYRETTNPDSPLIELGDSNSFLGRHIHVGFTADSCELVFQTDQGPVKIEQGAGPAEIKFKAVGKDGLLLQKTYIFKPDTYVIEVNVEAVNPTENQSSARVQASVASIPPASKASYYSFVGLVVLKDGKIEEFEVEKGEKSLSGKIHWVGYEDSYFISVIAPDKPMDATFLGSKSESGLLKGTLSGGETIVPPGGRIEEKFLLYLGPRDLGILSQAGHSLDKAIDFGWTDIIARPLLYVMRFFYGYIPNYGVAIILLTILVKILFWPLTHKSYKSMKEMQKLQPIMAKIRERHKGNKEELNRELMNLYKTYKVNPMSGCLPMIIQIPVFFALFRILGSAIELRHAPFMLWINDLSAPDRLFSFPFNIPLMTPPAGIPVLTLLMGASMFIQQKMTPTPGDPSQAKIMMFLPIIFTFMFINFPSGLVLYWLVNNILSIGQQYRIQKRPT